MLGVLGMSAFMSCLAWIHSARRERPLPFPLGSDTKSALLSIFGWWLAALGLYEPVHKFLAVPAPWYLALGVLALLACIPVLRANKRFEQTALAGELLPARPGSGV